MGIEEGDHLAVVRSRTVQLKPTTQFDMVVDFTIGHTKDLLVLYRLAAIGHDTESPKGHDPPFKGHALEIVGAPVSQRRTPFHHFCTGNIVPKTSEDATHLSSGGELYL